MTLLTQAQLINLNITSNKTEQNLKDKWNLRTKNDNKIIIQNYIEFPKEMHL